LNKHEILSKHEQSTHLIQIAAKIATRYAQKRSASASKKVHGILFLNLDCCKCARMRFHCAN